MLTKNIIKELIKKNKNKFDGLGIDLIGLFGSYARESQTPESDIDIFITFKEGQETFDNFMEISYLLDEVFKGKNVEIVTLNGLSPYIGPKILKTVEYV